MGKNAVIADQEQEERTRLVERAHRELALEGFERTAETESLFRAYVDGELTISEVLAELDRRYKGRG